MSSTTKKIAVTAIVVVGLATWFYYEGTTQALMERFPTIDPKIVRKVHKKMLLDVLRGKYPDASTDADYDVIFLKEIVTSLTSTSCSPSS